MKAKELSALVLLAALWGASFLFTRIAAPIMGPIFTIELRVIIAGVVLLLYSVFKNSTPNIKKYWKEFLIIGAINSAIPFTLIATALLNLNASISAILNSLTPIFATLVAWGWLKESLNFKKAIGIFLGIFGVIILVGWSPLPLTKTFIFSASLSILATIFYAFAGVYAKRAFTGVSPLELATGQQIGAALVLLPLAILNLPDKDISSIAIYSVVALAILCTAIAYLLYFYLIVNVGPTKTLSVTILVPLFGIIWSVVFLKEKITLGMVIGLFVITISILLIAEIKILEIMKFFKRRESDGSKVPSI